MSVRHSPKVLTNPNVGIIVVEHRDRLRRCGSGYIATLLAQHGRRVEVISPGDTGDSLVEDCVAGITSVAARSSGRRHSTRRAARLRAGVEYLMHSDSEDA
jgi:putative resolvase